MTTTQIRERIAAQRAVYVRLGGVVAPAYPMSIDTEGRVLLRPMAPMHFAWVGRTNNMGDVRVRPNQIRVTP